MESKTTIRRIFAGGYRISVPNYQRAYSWETPDGSSQKATHTDVFLKDLENHSKIKSEEKYYFGHFLFKKIDEYSFEVIDGQQRLTTIIIFLSALFEKIKSIRKLTDNEQRIYTDIVKGGDKNYSFSTVEYDNQFFIDYVIEHKEENKSGLETESAKRIVNAFDYFLKKLSDKDESYLTNILNIVINSLCTTHVLKNESEAIQMFIFQNNRGKKPTNLEIIKALFMYKIHLYSGESKEEDIKEITNRFEKIYKSISSIEHKIDEDNILHYTLQVYFNSLWESNSIDRINKELEKENCREFILDFSHSLEKSFDCLKRFYKNNDKECFEIHSLKALGEIGIVIPFIIKADKLNLIKEESFRDFCLSAESLVLRHRLIGTRAEIIPRINDTFQKFKKETDIEQFIGRINWMKEEKSYYWGHWNTYKLMESIQGRIDHTTAKYLLWKYENYLEGNGKKGYNYTRFDKVENPHLEHIAPQTPSSDNPVKDGYCDYDDEFRDEYLNCLGNYLLLSRPHNISISNDPFPKKREDYTHLLQQREIRDMTENREVWDKEKIKERKDKIIKFILENF